MAPLSMLRPRLQPPVRTLARRPAGATEAEEAALRGGDPPPDASTVSPGPSPEVDKRDLLFLVDHGFNAPDVESWPAAQILEEVAWHRREDEGFPTDTPTLEQYAAHYRERHPAHDAPSWSGRAGEVPTRRQPANPDQGDPNQGHGQQSDQSMVNVAEIERRLRAEAQTLVKRARAEAKKTGFTTGAVTGAALGLVAGGLIAWLILRSRTPSKG